MEYMGESILTVAFNAIRKHCITTDCDTCRLNRWCMENFPGNGMPHDWSVAVENLRAVEGDKDDTGREH